MFFGEGWESATPASVDSSALGPISRTESSGSLPASPWKIFRYEVLPNARRPLSKASVRLFPSQLKRTRKSVRTPGSTRAAAPL